MRIIDFLQTPFSLAQKPSFSEKRFGGPGEICS